MRLCLVFLFALPSLLAGNSGNPSESGKRISVADGSFETAWMVQIPSGSSDYLSTRYLGLTGTVEGIHLSIADAGTSFTAFPRVGVFRSNLTLDPSGTTPDLSSLITGGGPAAFPGGLPLYTTHMIPLAPATAEPDMHTVIQLPPGDPGLLGVGADSDLYSIGGDERGQSNPFESSATSADGYTTVANTLDSADFGLGPVIECGSDFTPQLALSTLGPGGERSGDYDLLTTVNCAYLDTPFGLSFWGDVVNQTPSQWKLFISFLGVPLIPIGVTLPSTDCGNGHCFSSFTAQWPQGAGNLTINLVAVAGIPGVQGSVAVSNEVDLASKPTSSSNFGTLDDGSFESGWIVQNPSGDSDFFSVPWGDAGFCPFPLSQSSYAVMDFGTSATAYPRTGQAPPNFVVDPSGNSPDLSNPYVDSPLLFAPLTFVTTAGQMVQNSYPPYSPATDVIEFLQFPPGDPGLLGIVADTNGAFVSGVSGWSLDGYATPANLFGNGNWGMRTQ